MKNLKQLFSGELVNTYSLVTAYATFNLLTTDTLKTIQLKKSGLIVRSLTVELVGGSKTGGNWFVDGILFISNLSNYVVILEYRNGILTLTPFSNNTSTSFLAFKVDLDVDTIQVI